MGARAHGRVGLAVTAVLAVLAVVAGCGADDGDEDPERPSTPASSDEPADATVVALSGRQLCRAVPANAAGRALRTEVAQAQPVSEPRAGCRYTYGGDSSSLGTVLVESAPAGGAVAEAFEAWVGDRDAVELDLGDGVRAVRLEGRERAVVLSVDSRVLRVSGGAGLGAAALEALALRVGRALSASG